MSDARHNSVRRGVTLVELLVVVGIMLVLVTIAIPVFRPFTENRRIREPARALNVFFGSTRNRAIETGRAHGVMFERLERQPQASITVRRVEVPPAYNGDFEDAAVRVMDYTHLGPADNVPPWASPPGPYPFYWHGGPRVLKLMVRDLDLSPGLVRRGDQVQLNHQGPWYTIVYDDNDIDDNGSFEWPPSFPKPASAPVLPDFPVDGRGYINFFDPPGKAVDSISGTWIISHLLTVVLDARSAYQSPFYYARQSGGADTWTGTLGMSPDPLMRLAFEIERQPVPTPDLPLQLSRGAVIDLDASGFDRQRPFLLVDRNAPSTLPNDPNPWPLPLPLSSSDLRARPVIVMFAPNGSVSWVHQYQLVYDPSGDVIDGQYVQQHAAEPVHFLVGKWDRIPVQPGGPAQAEDGLENWQDANNLWVTLNPQTGLVTVAELHADQLDPTTNTYRPSSLDVARQLARQAQISKGGR